MTNQEIQAIRGHLEGVEKGFYKNMNILSEVYLKDVPKLLNALRIETNRADANKKELEVMDQQLLSQQQENRRLREENERLKQFKEITELFANRDILTQIEESLEGSE